MNGENVKEWIIRETAAEVDGGPARGYGGMLLWLLRPFISALTPTHVPTRITGHHSHILTQNPCNIAVISIESCPSQIKKKMISINQSSRAKSKPQTPGKKQPRF